MYPLIQALRSELVAIIKYIDNSDYNISDVDDMNEVITVLRKTTHQDKPMSKYAVCEYLYISHATFDNYVADGKIPPGRNEQGFKELSWYKKDLEEYKEKYRKVKNNKQ